MRTQQVELKKVGNRVQYLGESIIPVEVADSFLSDKKETILIDSPTGSGKTVGLVEIIKQIRKKDPTRVVKMIAVIPKNDTVISILSDLRKAFPEWTVAEASGREGCESLGRAVKKKENSIVVSTHAQFQNYDPAKERHKRTKKGFEDTILVIDEAHALVTTADYTGIASNRIIDTILGEGSEETKERIFKTTLLLTGTSSPLEEVELGVDTKYLVTEEAPRVEYDMVILKKPEGSKVPDYRYWIEDMIKAHKAGDTTAVFYNSKENAKIIEEVLIEEGFSVARLNADTKETEFHKQLIKTGKFPEKIDFLLTTSVLEEGFSVKEEGLTQVVFPEAAPSITIKQFAARSRTPRDGRVEIRIYKTRGEVERWTEEGDMILDFIEHAETEARVKNRLGEVHTSEGVDKYNCIHFSRTTGEWKPSEALARHTQWMYVTGGEDPQEDFRKNEVTVTEQTMEYEGTLDELSLKDEKELRAIAKAELEQDIQEFTRQFLIEECDFGRDGRKAQEKQFLERASEKDWNTEAIAKAKGVFNSSYNYVMRMDNLSDVRVRTYMVGLAVDSKLREEEKFRATPSFVTGIEKKIKAGEYGNVPMVINKVDKAIKGMRKRADRYVIGKPVKLPMTVDKEPFTDKELEKLVKAKYALFELDANGNYLGVKQPYYKEGVDVEQTRAKRVEAYEKALAEGKTEEEAVAIAKAVAPVKVQTLSPSQIKKLREKLFFFTKKSEAEKISFSTWGS